MSHKFIGLDRAEYDDETIDGYLQCLTCGGVWQNNVCPAHSTKECAPYAGAIDGTVAVECSTNTNQCHHYADECSTLPFTGTCSLDPDCNCLYCHS